MPLRSRSEASQDLKQKCPVIPWHPYFMLGQEVALALLSAFHAQNWLYLRETYSSDGRTMHIVKFRTLKQDLTHADVHLKELHQPNGKIHAKFHEGKYTSLGKFLSKSWLDELPSLFRDVMIQSRMNVVGIRPLLLIEREQTYKKYFPLYQQLGLKPWWRPVKRIFYRDKTPEEALKSYLHDAASYKQQWNDPNSLWFVIWLFKKTY